MKTPEGGRWGWPGLVVVLTAAYALIPYLLEPQFYQRGDTAAQFAPIWFNLGEQVRDGLWPVWLDTHSWAGGNYAAEGLFGIYNPLNALVFVGVSLAGDLVLATLAVKVTTMVLLALGTYLVAREYSAARWASALVAVALPFGGFTLFWDAGSWPSGLMAFAYLPWVWWTFRRALRGVANPFWAFLAGALAVLHGNPYGTLAVVVVGVAMLAEGVVARAWRGVLRIAVVGALVACLLPLVYLPLLESADLAVRSTGAMFENSGKLRPTLGDLFAASSPLHVPPIRAITGQMAVPATFLAWFVLPLLPWLRYSVLRGRGREFVGLGLITVGYMAMALGPSKLWLFRWPLRVIEHFYLGVMVVVAVLLTAGLANDRVRARLFSTAAIVAAMGWLTWSQDPASLKRAALGTVVVAVGIAALLAAHLILRRPLAVAAVALAGVGAVLALQISVFGENASSRVWHVPSDVSALEADFSDLEGRTMQFADLKPLQKRGEIATLEEQWTTFLPGSMHQPAGVEVVNNYTGMGFLPFTKTFCMEYDGLTQKCGYRALWQESAPGAPVLADMMKLDTVVVQKKLAEGVKPADGWSVTDEDKRAYVLTRDESNPWPGSELSHASDGVAVAGASDVGAYGQAVDVSAPDGGQLTFSLLGWPGWEAQIDGEPLEVGYNSFGLLTVALPPGAAGTVELTFRPPGLGIGMVGAVVALLGALALGIGSAVTRRRGTRAEDAPAENSPAEDAPAEDTPAEETQAAQA